MADYTVTIGKLSGATIALERENLTNVSLAVSPTNDPNHLSLRADDTINWEIDTSTLNGWVISQIGMGKKLVNKNSSKTEEVFSRTEEISDTTVPRPAGVFNLRKIPNPMVASTITTNENADNPRSRLKFVYKILFKNKADPSKRWWVDPEIDVTPAMSG